MDVRQQLLESAERHVIALREERETLWEDLAQLRRVVAVYRELAHAVDADLHHQVAPGSPRVWAALAVVKREDHP